jgi:hypothetical protein
MAFKKFFILATKRIEVRGYIYAHNEKHAAEKVRSCWHIHDVGNNEVSAHSSSTSSLDTPPTIGEFEAPIQILHIELVKEK